MNTDKHEKQRRQYRKPGIRIVKLSTKEVLGFGCKLSSTSGAGVLPTNPCIPAGCQFDTGS